jgi:drug/metabolite transporter (DMT)-like permease
MRPEFFIIASIFGWGVGSFFYKFANAAIHPVLVNSIALCLYIVLLPLMWIFIKFDHTITISGIAYTLAGALCMCIGTLGFSYALRSGAAVGQTTILCALYPALTLSLSMMFLGEVLTIKKGIGIMLALISFALLSIK